MTRELQEKLESYQRVWAEVDLDAIWENMVHMKENIAENTKILAVIKTDGYGHGGVPIAKMLEQLDFMFGYAAATYEEAHVLREEGVKKPILILGYPSGSLPQGYGGRAGHRSSKGRKEGKGSYQGRYRHGKNRHYAG